MNYPYYIAADDSKVKIEDATVLNNIARNKNQTQYVRIQMLNLQDQPIEAGVIHGRVTGGNISLNSTSPVRRSGSLSLVADETNCDITNLNNIIAINKRAKIEIGLKNDFGLSVPAKDNKIWFSLGVFVLSNVNINKSLSGLNISINLKDKMALLNGECGGVIYTMATHSPLYNADGTVEPVPFEALIESLVRDWGKIPENKIQIEDIDDFIENTYSWHGAQPLYVGISLDSDGKKLIPQYVSLTSRPQIEGITQNIFLTRESVGYSYKKNTYPGTLTSAVGETITSVLDKIKKALGNYEYFFDIEGNFIFRKIPNYLNEGSALDNLADAFGEGYLTVSINGGKAQFDFQDEELIISCSNQPKYEAIKNDYVVWGAKGDSKTPIRYHLVIDNRPTFSTGTFTTLCYTDNFGVLRAVPKDQTIEGAVPKTIKIEDWRAWLYYDYVVNGNYNDYGQELEVEFPKQYDLENGQYYHEQGTDDEQKAKLYDLVYWLDFLDPNDIVNGVDKDGKPIDKSSVKNALNAISVTNIGRKTKTIKDESINCIFNIRPLDILLIPAGTADTAAMRDYANNADDGKGGKGVPYYQVGPDISNKMELISWNNSAYDTIRAVIHETTAYNNVISLTTIPIFHLEPSMRVNVNITEEGKPIAVGHYMINSLSVPLAYNGNMTINASRAIERI